MWDSVYIFVKLIVTNPPVKSMSIDITKLYLLSYLSTSNTLKILIIEGVIFL